MRSTPIITGLILVATPVGVLGLAALLLWLSGDWRWVEGWIFGVWWVSFMAAIVLWLHYKGSCAAGRAHAHARQRR